MKKKQWKARAKRAERELRDQKAVGAALEESVKRLRGSLARERREHNALLDGFNALDGKHAQLLTRHAQLQREYEELSED